MLLTGLIGLLCLFLAVPANAQRGGGHSSGGGGGGSHFSGGGGGGGGSHFSGGGGGGGSHFSGGGGFSGRSSGSFSGRVSSGYSRQGVTGNTRAFSPNGVGVNGNTRTFNTYRGAGVTGNTRTLNSYNGAGVTGNTRTLNSYRGAGVTGNTRTFNTYRGAGVTGNRNTAGARGGFYRGGTYAGGRGYSGYGPWSRQGGYYYNRGFYGSLYYPRLGFDLGFLPFGYYPFLWDDSQFYFSDGYFYQQNNDQYTVVEPPIGAAINTLPAKAQPITINGQQYYELNGVYYLPVTRDDGSVVYQIAGKDGQLDTNTDQGNGVINGNGNNNSPAVAAPEPGDIFYSLPPDTRKIKINGEQYFVSPDDYYYQETRDNNNAKAYKVVGTPSDGPGN